MRAPLIIGLAGLMAVALAPQAPAEDLEKAIVGAILHPEDAQRFEERAHRNRRPDEERYWHDYRVGLQRQGRHEDDRHEDDRRDPERRR